MGLPGAAAQIVFLAPMEAMNQIKREGVGNLPLLPYSSMAVNGCVWATYGLLLCNYFLVSNWAQSAHFVNK